MLRALPVAIFLVAAPVTFSLASLIVPSVAEAQPVVVERVAAVVNSEIVLLSEVRERAAQMGAPLDENGSPEVRREREKQLKQLVDRMVDDLLILQQASELKLSVEQAEIDRAIDEVKKQNGLNQAQFESALLEQGFSMTAYRKDLRKQILRLKVINTAVRSRITISEEEIKAFYDQSARQSGGHREAHVRHVLVLVPPAATERDLEQKRRIAVRVLEEARSGGDFVALARTYSEDSVTKNEGGDLGWVKEGEGLPEALNEVVFTMDPKEIRGPLRTERGFEVVQLIERKDGDVKPLAEAKDQIRQQLYSQQLEKQTQLWLAELRKKAHVDVKM